MKEPEIERRTAKISSDIAKAVLQESTNKFIE
jgi:hypothetical protein